jgi:ribosomal protein S18 acetylase RimI-like enzyme
MVVFPDFQGIGVAKALTEVVARLIHNGGYDVITTTSNPACIASLKKSGNWICTNVGRMIAKTFGIASLDRTMSGRSRVTASFEYHPKRERENYRTDGERL